MDVLLRYFDDETSQVPEEARPQRHSRCAACRVQPQARNRGGWRVGRSDQGLHRRHHDSLRRADGPAGHAARPLRSPDCAPKEGRVMVGAAHPKRCYCATCREMCHVKHPQKLCSKCGANPVRSYGQQWCRSCHAEYARTHHRRYRDLTPEQKKRANARSIANVYQRRGKLVPQPCGACGSADAQKHHPDYSRPLFVLWLCRECHSSHHLRERFREVA